MLGTGLAYSVLCMLAYALTNVFFKISANMELNAFLLVSLSSLVAGLLLLLKGGPSGLAVKALRSKYTWLYGISEFLDLCFVLMISYYISATEGALVTRIAIVLSVITAHFFLKRSAFRKEYFGLIPVILGLVIVFGSVENLSIVFTLAVLVAIARNIYYFSIELHPVPYETKNMVQDYAVIGYIVSAAGVVVLGILTLHALTAYISGVHFIAEFPAFSEFKSFQMLAMSVIFGSTFLFATKVLEFKAIGVVKTEMFNCIVAFSPLATMMIEMMLNHASFYTVKLNLTPHILMANFLIVGGGFYIFFKRYANPQVENEKEIEDTKSLIHSAIRFTDNNKEEAATLLGVDLQTLNDILIKNLSLKKDIAEKIAKNHHKNIAMSDALTGLPSRLKFEADIAGSSCGNCALLFIDLNKFKAVNDTHGHEAGDFILKGTARRLKLFVEDHTLNAKITRLGGDEFCIFIENTSKKEALKLAPQIVKTISKPYTLPNKSKVDVGAAIGVAHFPSDATDKKDLIQIADSSMYANKKQ